MLRSDTDPPTAASFPIIAAVATRSSISLTEQHIRDLGVPPGRASVQSGSAAAPQPIPAEENMPGNNNNNGGGFGKPHVPSYDGKEDVRYFVDKLDIYFKLCGVTDDANKRDMLVLQCQGDASHHIIAVMRGTTTPTYDSLRQSLISRFGGATQTWMNKLVALRQLPHQSVSSYADLFRGYLLHAGQSAENVLIVNMFINNLVYVPCRFHVRDRKPTTIDEALQLADTWEQSFSQQLPFAQALGWIDGVAPTALPALPLTSLKVPPATPVPVYHVAADAPLTQNCLMELLAAQETRLSNGFTQYVQAVINEVSPLVKPNALPAVGQQQSQRANNQQQGAGNGGGGNRKGGNNSSNNNSTGSPPGHAHNQQWHGWYNAQPHQQQQWSGQPPPWYQPAPYSLPAPPVVTCQLCSSTEHVAKACPGLVTFANMQAHSPQPLQPQRVTAPAQQQPSQPSPATTSAQQAGHTPQQAGTAPQRTYHIVTEQQPAASVYATVGAASVGSTPLYCTVTVHGVETADGVMDSGSGVTLISGRLFDQLPVEVRSRLSQPAHSIQVKSASESILVVRGELVLDMVLQGKLELNKPAVLVIDGLAADVIVGNDQLQHLEGLSAKYNTVQYWDNMTGQLVNLPLSPRRQPLQSFSVFITRTTRIQPRSEFVGQVGAVVPDDKQHIRRLAAAIQAGDTCCMVESVADQPANMQLASSLVQLDTVLGEGCIPISIENTGDSKLVLLKGARVAVVSLITPECVLATVEGGVVSPTTCSLDKTEAGSCASASVSAVSLSVATEVSDPVSEVDMTRCKLQADDRVKLVELLHSYADCFAANPKNPSTTTVTQHSIVTGDAKPIKLPPYRVARQHESFIRSEIEQLLVNGQIEKSSSPWSFPVVVVLKKDGSLRFCIDYRKLNAVTKKDGHPVPNIGELLDCLHGSTLYSTLDLASGYWQVVVAEADREKTAFVTKYGLYQWRTMPFGLATAPATFVRLMEEVLSDLRWKCVIVYFDDITVYSKSVEEHLVHLRLVFDRLRQAKLQAKGKKCVFGTDTISFLGYTVSAAGIQPDGGKVAAIRQFPTPHDVTSLKSFLGLTNFYRIFVQGYSAIAKALNRLLCKGQQFGWDEQCESAFQQLKDGLMAAPILATADFDVPFTVYTDASKYALGAILGQVQDTRPRVVAYASRTFNKHECHYSVSEKEALAIVWAINHWQHYLLGDRQFTVVTDHHPLTGLRTIKDMHGRLGRWSLALQHYNFVVQYRPGEKNQVDALSRIEVDTTDSPRQYTESSVKPMQSIDQLLCPTAPVSHQVVSSFALTRVMQAGPQDESGESSSDEGSEDERGDGGDEKYHQPVSPIVAYGVGDRVLVSGLLEQGPYTILRRTSPVDYDVQLDSDSSITISVGIDQLTHYYHEYKRMDEGRQAEQVLPAVEQFNCTQRQDSEWAPLITYLECGTIPPDAVLARRVQQQRPRFAIDNNQSLVYTAGVSHGSGPVSAAGCLVVPYKMRPVVLAAMHDCPLSGHMGVKKTLDRLVHRFWWPKMAVDVQRWISSCTLCARRKSPKGVDKPIRSILPGESAGYSAPFAELVVDTLGPLSTTKRQNKYVVIFMDRLTRWPEAYAVRNQRS